MVWRVIRYAGGVILLPVARGRGDGRLRDLADALVDGDGPPKMDKPRVSDEELAAIGYESVDSPAKYEDAGPMAKHIWLTGARAIREKLGA